MIVSVVASSFIGTRRRLVLIHEHPNIAINGHRIKREMSYKCLGIELDEVISWDVHISNVVSKVARATGALRRLKPYLPQSTLILIYKSLILTNFGYCDSVWGNLGRGLTLTLEQLQYRAARIILGAVCFFLLVSNHLSQKFVQTNVIHNHNLRDSNLKFFVPKPQSEALKKRFTCRGAAL